MNGPRYLQELATGGRYHFTLPEAAKALDASPVAVRAVLRRTATEIGRAHV